jgi:hypothetical protein
MDQILALLRKPSSEPRTRPRFNSRFGDLRCAIWRYANRRKEDLANYAIWRYAN